MTRLIDYTLATLLVLATFAAYAAGDSSLRGTCLVADESMAGSPFARTVILMIEHGPDGAFGLVLNRRTSLSLADVLPSKIKADGERDYPLHTGGPVRQQQLGLLLRGEPIPDGTEAILADVAYTAEADLMDELLADAPEADRVRVFAGYAGWAPRQLEAELRRNAWHIVPADSEAVFSAPDSGLWQRLLKRIGEAPAPQQSL